jgi:XTP/dITP diphosphohydrolase
LAAGTWEGTVIREPRGLGGFGYDPIFVPNGFDRTAAELDPGEKNSLSHRGQALAALVAQLQNRP